MPIRALANTSSIMDRRRIFALCVQNNTDFTNFKDSIWLPLSIALIPAWKFDDNHNNRFSPMSAIRTHFLAKNPLFANLDRWKWKINSTTKFFCKKNSILVRKVEILCLEIIYDFQSKVFNRRSRGFFKKMPEISGIWALKTPSIRFWQFWHMLNNFIRGIFFEHRDL